MNHMPPLVSTLLVQRESLVNSLLLGVRQPVPYVVEFNFEHGSVLLVLVLLV